MNLFAEYFITFEEIASLLDVKKPKTQGENKLNLKKNLFHQNQLSNVQLSISRWFYKISVFRFWLNFSTPTMDNTWLPYRAGAAYLHEIRFVDGVQKSISHVASREVAFWLQYLPHLDTLHSSSERSESLNSTRGRYHHDHRGNSRLFRRILDFRSVKQLKQVCTLYFAICNKTAMIFM